MKFKDYEPIKFEIFQTDMEKIMRELQYAIAGTPNIEQLGRIKKDLQHKINIHRERGEWK